MRNNVTIQSRCGLLCSTCGLKESGGCDTAACGKLHAYSRPGHGDDPPDARVVQRWKWAKTTTPEQMGGDGGAVPNR